MALAWHCSLYGHVLSYQNNILIKQLWIGYRKHSTNLNLLSCEQIPCSRRGQNDNTGQKIKSELISPRPQLHIQDSTTWYHTECISNSQNIQKVNVMFTAPFHQAPATYNKPCKSFTYPFLNLHCLHRHDHLFHIDRAGTWLSGKCNAA